MYCYKIGERIEEVTLSSFKGNDFQFAAVVTPTEWNEKKPEFDMGIEMEIGLDQILGTSVEVNYDSLTGSFYIPDRANITERAFRFAFALDEKGIVFIDDGDTARDIINRIMKSKKFPRPSLERFMYDFLEQIILKDQKLLEGYDHTLDEIEEQILDGSGSDALIRISDVRNDLRDLRFHYSQLIDLCQEFEENENGFFKEDNERYFHLVGHRVENLYTMVGSLMDHCVQLRDYQQSITDIKQNKTIALLTIVSTIFMPLTLIVGWYGMNFRYMPELESKWGYPGVFIGSVLVVVLCLIFFKKKKWL